MLWNIGYNALFDHFWPTTSVRRTFGVRLLHGIGFEAGLLVLCIPIAAYMLDITWLQAVVVEVGFFAFVLPYTVIYNWLYDKIREYASRERWTKERSNR